MRKNMSTGGKARSRMYAFVSIIFVIGLLFAGYYVFGKTPGETETAPASEVVNPKS
jgi:hypothetical protein